jgi:hypothetical protein
LDNLLSGLVGAAIGGGATIWAQFVSIGSQRKQQKLSEDLLIRGFVQAIADEVTSVWDRYSVEIGPHLKNLPDGEASIVFPLHQSSLCSTRTHPFLVEYLAGNYENKSLPTYVEAKGFVDSMHYYERLVDTYNAQKTQPIQMTTSATVADSVTIHVPDEKNRPLLGYSEQLKLAHSRLEDKMQELKRLLQAFLDSSSS